MTLSHSTLFDEEREKNCPGYYSPKIFQSNKAIQAEGYFPNLHNINDFLLFLVTFLSLFYIVLLDIRWHYLHRITEWLRLEGTSGGHLVQPFAQARPPRASGPGSCPDGFRMSARMEDLQPPWATCASAQLPSQFKSVS